MEAIEFVRTLYLGDRACKRIVIDGWTSSIRISIDRISRVRSPTGNWDYYTEEDVEDGDLVFDGVTSFVLVNGGFLPNDAINSIEAEADGDQVRVKISIDSVSDDASHHEAEVTLCCKSIYIEDPSSPGTKITE